MAPPIDDENELLCENGTMSATVVDLFCGIGGLSYGFRQEGFQVIAGIDSDASCQYAFESNLGANFVSADVTQVTAAALKRMFAAHPSDKRILIGCAPCTPFTLYVGRYKKERRKRDGRWQLLEEFGRLARIVRPDVVSMENVPRLVGHPVFKKFVKTLEMAGYTVSFKKVRADHYGVPQKRSRLVLLASRFGKVEFPDATHLGKPLTVRDAIGDLPPIEAGRSCSTDRLHQSRSLSSTNLRRIKSTSEGGSWKDWDAKLQLECHRREGGRSFRSVYGRMKWDSPSPVITTQCLGIGNGRFGHPEQDRAISIREAALLQSFPKSFKFLPPRAPVSGATLARQIGNAVPVRLGRVIARAIREHLNSAAAGARTVTEA